MERNLTLTLFTPAEVERITGVTTMTQRDWRRRSIVPKRGEGHARYNLFELAEMFAIKLLSDRGVPLEEASNVALWCGMGIGFRVLQWVDAYEGDHLRTNEARGIPDTRMSDSDLELVRAAAAQGGIDLPEGLGERYVWGDKGDWLARQVYRQQYRTGVVPGKLFIWWANGTHLFHESFDAARDDMVSSDPRLAGPSLVLDLESLGSVLSDRAGRAFVHVEFPDLPPSQGDDANVARQSAITVPGASAPGQTED